MNRRGVTLRLRLLLALLVSCWALTGLAGAARADSQTPSPVTTTATEGGGELTDSPTVSPTDDETSEPTVSPTDGETTEPSVSPTDTAEPSASPGETTSPATTEPSASPDGDGSDRPGEGTAVLESVRRAGSASQVPTLTWSIALAVLAVSGLLLIVLRSPGQRRRAGAPAPSGPPSPAGDTFAAIEAIGEAMTDAGYSVGTIQAALRDVARVNGYPATEIVVFPTALIVSTRGEGELLTGAVASGTSRLLLHQVDALDRLVGEARIGAVDPAEVRPAIAALRAAPAPYSRALRVVAYSFVSVALAVLLGASWLGLAVAAVLGTVVGGVLLAGDRGPREFAPLVTVAMAFVVSTSVLLLTRAGWDPGVLPSLIAPLVILLPGALLTTGVIELSSGQVMSGAGRLAAGSMQLVLLAVGLVAGAMLVGVPRIELNGAYEPIGPLGPWLAVAVFGIGIVVHQGGRPRSIPWILLVLYVAYGAQVIGSILLGGVLSAMIGALAMTPVAILVSRHTAGPAAMVSFLPAFWLLVPGALGLVGVTTILSGDSTGGATIVTTMATMVAIALGILAGSAVSSRVGQL